MDREDSGRTGWLPRLIGVLAGHTGHFVCLVMLLFILSFQSMFCDLDADEDWLVSLDEYLAEMSKTPRKTFK